MLSQKEQKIIIQSMRPYNPIKIGVFGSVAKNKETIESDIDIAYSFDSDFGLFELDDLTQDLEKKLNKKVDLVDFDFLNPIIKDTILKDMILLFHEPTFSPRRFASS